MTPTATFIDRLIADQESRHAWLFKAGEQCRKWSEEERAIAASGTVAGAPAGLSRVAPSQAKPLIDYRKEEESGHGL